MRRCWLLLLLCLIPFRALAQPVHAPYDYRLSLAYRALNAGQQALFDLLYDAAWQGSARVELPAGTAYTDAELCMQALLNEAPELCALDDGYAIAYYRTAPDTATAVTLRYCGPVAIQHDTLAAARRTLDTLRYRGIAAPDAWEHALLIHDWVCDHTDYAYGAGSASAAGVLLHGAAVCEGYTEAMVLLCRLWSIPCSAVRGVTTQGERHSWVLAEAAPGSYFQADPTWDDQSYPLHACYGFADADHVPDPADAICALLPRTLDADLAYHVRRDLIAPDDPDALVAWLSARLPGHSNGTPLELRFLSAEAYADCLAHLHTLLAACSAPDDAAPAYAFMADDARLCLTLIIGPQPR